MGVAPQGDARGCVEKQLPCDRIAEPVGFGLAADFDAGRVRADPGALRTGLWTFHAEEYEWPRVPLDRCLSHDGYGGQETMRDGVGRGAIRPILTTNAQQSGRGRDRIGTVPPLGDAPRPWG